MVEQFKISCSKENLKLIRKLLISFLSKQAISDIDRNLIVLAVDEMCANIMIHSVGLNPSKSVDIELRVDGDKIVINIQHDGTGFDLVGYNEPSLDQLMATRRKGGIGIRLIKKIMDDIRIETKEDKCTYRMTKKLNLQS